jgi:hypothetical protein
MRTVISDTCDRTQILYILSEHAAEYREQGEGVALLSVIILSPDGYATVQALMRCLKKQSLRKELELVFVVPVGTVESLDAVDARDFATVKKIEVEDMKRSAHARAAGIRAGHKSCSCFNRRSQLAGAGMANLWFARIRATGPLSARLFRMATRAAVSAGPTF